METFGLTEEDVERLIVGSIDYVFASEEEKAELRALVIPQLKHCGKGLLSEPF